MNQNHTSALVAAALLAMIFAPTGGSVPSTPPDATVVGPISIDAKGISSAGIGLCIPQDGSSGFPPSCGSGSGTPGALGAGVYAHDTTPCVALFGCIYDIWAIQATGAHVTGWSVTACTDRDDDLTCSNGAPFDDFSYGYKGDELSGQNKEKKHPDWAHTGFCVRPDLDRTYDNFWVFINNWVDENLVFPNDNDNTGTGLSTGTYEVYVQYVRDASSEADCLASIDDPSPVSTYLDP